MGLFRRKQKPEPEPSAPARPASTPNPQAARPRPPVWSTPKSEISYGTPGRCSECGTFGFVDVIDVVNRFQSQHCPSCQHSWEFHFDADGKLVSAGTDPDRDVVDVRDIVLVEPSSEDVHAEIESLRPR